MLGIVKDDPVALEDAIAYAIANADLVISSGGVSVGDYDYIDRILEKLEAKIHVRAVAMRPGKPLTVATFSPRPHPTRVGLYEQSPPARAMRFPLYFGLPGNPAAVLVTFLRFVQPAIKKISGLAEGWETAFVKVRSHQELRSDGKRETYVWGKLQLIDGVYKFHKAGGSHSSGNLINLAQTNALAVIPVGKTLISPNEQVQVLLSA